MSDSAKTGCLFCDFGDVDIMRNNGYAEEKYVYCEVKEAIVEVIKNCPLCKTNHIEEKKEAKMNFLIKQMAEAMEREGFISNN